MLKLSDFPRVIPIFIGYDKNEPLPYHVLSHSILTRSSHPVSINPVNVNSLRHIFTRERHPLQSTDFSFTRFLVPYLKDYCDWAIFMDCDMLCLSDIADLYRLADINKDVMCVKHEHIPEEDSKFLEQPQTKYKKKNWSSLMMFNCYEVYLSPDDVNTRDGLYLHQFKWLKDPENQIGELPLSWNFLVDYNSPDQCDKINMLHYTKGGPWFKEYQNCSFAKEWFEEYDKMCECREGIGFNVNLSGS